MRIIILLFFSNFLIGQEFITTFYLENSMGELDSVQIGYDTNASLGIDPNFGEADISSSAFASGLEARVGLVDLNFMDCDVIPQMNASQFVIHNSKIDIIPNYCDGWEDFIRFSTLFVKNDHYPLKISWSSQVFETDCLDGALITDWIPGGWFDAVCGTEIVPPTKFINANEVIVDQITGIHMIDNFGDSISLFYLPLFLDGTSNTENEESLKQLIFYPNPTTGQVFMNHSQKNRFSIYDHQGRLIKEGTGDINLSNEANGVYIIQVLDDQGNSVSKKVIKHN